MIKADKIYRTIFYLISVFFAGSLIYYYPRLPETVASHFDFSGKPDGWMTKEWFLIFMLFIFGILAGIVFLVNYLLKKNPESITNLPNKKYHLSAEKKEETIKTINNFLLLSISLTIALLIVVNFLTFSFNLGFSDKLSSSFEIILIVYLIIIFFLILKLYLKFKKVPTQSP